MHKKLVGLVEKKRKFWLPKNIDPEDTCGAKTMQTAVLFLANLFGLVLFSCLVCYVAEFIVFGSLDLWTPKTHPHLAFAIMICSLSWGSFACASTFVFNVFIVPLCVEVAIQFRMLNYRMSQMENKWKGIKVDNHLVLREIKEIIKQHNFLLG